jgi:hypothetical protein
MKTPSMITPGELFELVDLFLRTKARRIDAADVGGTVVGDWLSAKGISHWYVCTVCNTPIERQEVAFSLHAAEFPGCCGPGKVFNGAVPFCPTCEEVPSAYGCLHVPYREAHLEPNLSAVAQPEKIRTERSGGE